MSVTVWHKGVRIGRAYPCGHDLWAAYLDDGSSAGPLQDCQEHAENAVLSAHESKHGGDVRRADVVVSKGIQLAGERVARDFMALPAAERARVWLLIMDLVKP
jgi:hypothetical protein